MTGTLDGPVEDPTLGQGRLGVGTDIADGVDVVTDSKHGDAVIPHLDADATVEGQLVEGGDLHFHATRPSF